MSDMHETTGKIGGARCRDRTYDIRLVRAVYNNNSLILLGASARNPDLFRPALTSPAHIGRYTP